MKSSTAVVILAAGAGTRMKSKTSKVLHGIGGRTLLAHAIHAAAGLAPDHLVVVVGHEAEAVGGAARAVGSELGIEVRLAVQGQQLGTGDAVRAGLAALPIDFDGAVLVTAADVPLLDAATLRDLIAAHTALPAAAVTLLSSTADDPTGYGRVLRTQDGEVTEIVEEKLATDQQRLITEVNAGVYAFDFATLTGALGELSSDNAQGELLLTDVISIAVRADKVVRGKHIEDAARVAGCNDRVQLSDLGAELNRRIIAQHQRAGVTVVDPSSTWIDVTVTLDIDVTLKPGTGLHGRTVVGEGAVIGPDTTLTDVTVGEFASVRRSEATESIIGAHANVGPFSYLRPGTDLGDATKVGAFVETKNATIGDGSKVPHLSYVGDATIGEHSNIGCSSVFVNYDGVNKSRTVVGDHVRIASDTMLVAPVQVGDGAYTGAGTVLKEDVPPGALAVSGGKQRNIEGWVLRNRSDTPSAIAAGEAIAAAQALAAEIEDDQQ